MYIASNLFCSTRRSRLGNDLIIVFAQIFDVLLRLLRVRLFLAVNELFDLGSDLKT